VDTSLSGLENDTRSMGPKDGDMEHLKSFWTSFVSTILVDLECMEPVLLEAP
jgi:hypothetical protein